jgi:voltage-gated potassium channel
MRKRANAYVLFGRAFKNAKKDFWVSIEVLLAITFVLALIFYFVEHTAQPDVYKNPWNAFVWAITRYIGDPGHFGGSGPVTLTGRYIDTFIGILKILIFAVPAGLVANGFRKAMEDDKRDRFLEDCRDKILKSFPRILNKKYLYRAIERRLSLVSLQARKNMSEKDIIDTVSKFDEFRLRNLAGAQTAAEHPQDRLVIELIPFEEKTIDGFDIKRTDYGIKLDRGSDVTIIAPTAAGENGIGHFAYYLAQFGGFNYVSREIFADVDDPVSYFTIDKEDKHLDKFVEDIKTLSSGRTKWNIVLVSSDDVYDTQFHFILRANPQSGMEYTVLDLEKARMLFDSVSSVMRDEYGYLSDLDEKYRPVGKKNIGVVAGGGVDNNSIVLRVSYGVTTWSDTSIPIIVDLAKEIKRILEKPERAQFEENPCWKEKGCGYGINRLSK